MNTRRSRGVSAVLALVAFGVVPAAGPDYSPNLPDPPAGYSWKKLPEVRASFLLPDGWYFKEESRGQTRAYFITREDIDVVGRYFTGLTVQVVRDLGDRKAVPWAQEFVAKRSGAGELINSAQLDSGVMKGFSCVTKELAGEDQTPIVVHTVAIGNEKSNTLYIIIFETPEKLLPADQEIGQKLLQMFVIDNEL